MNYYGTLGSYTNVFFILIKCTIFFNLLLFTHKNNLAEIFSSLIHKAFLKANYQIICLFDFASLTNKALNLLKNLYFRDHIVDLLKRINITK